MSKYKAVPTAIDGVIFASKKEAARYAELKMLLKIGLIKDLQLQPRFPLVVNGIKVCEYRGDFRYMTKDEADVIEDVKSVATKTVVYRLKSKLFHALYPHLRITEII